MAKRMTDTECWGDPWYQGLPPLYKLFWKYICDNCDCAGVWKVNRSLAEFQIGAAIDWESLLSAFNGRIAEVTPEKWHVVKFVEFQYGRLSYNCKPHIPVIRALEHHGLSQAENERVSNAPRKAIDVVEEKNVENERVCKGYTKGIHTLEEKEKDKEQEKEEDKDLLLFPPTQDNSRGVVDVSLFGDEICESINSAGAGARESGPDPPKPKKPPPERHKYGEYKHVLLTDEAYARRVEKYGEKKLKEYIRIVDEYCQLHGKGYKDYGLAIDKFIAKDKEWGEDGYNKKNSGNGGRKIDEYDRRYIERLRAGG